MSSTHTSAHTQPPALRAGKDYREPVFGRPHLAEHLDEILKRLHSTVMPVWPLNDYVAVNPYAGIADRQFLDARAFLRVFSSCELLMPVSHYAQLHRQGQLRREHIQAAIDECQADGLEAMPADLVIDALRDKRQSQAAAKWNTHQVRPLSAFVDRVKQTNWTSHFDNEVSKYCAGHYDEGQAVWGADHRHLPLYQAWRQAAEHDRNIEFLGLKGFRKFVSQLPHTAETAIVRALQRLGVPQRMWETVLLAYSYALPGWSAWTRYQTEQAAHAGLQRNDLAGLLAMRLAYDVALAQTHNFSVDWQSFSSSGSVDEASSSFACEDDALLRYQLLKATEIAYRSSLLANLHSVSPPSAAAEDTADAEQAVPDRKLAQLVFCIDVRSERYRRHLESLTDGIETFGFAGFFGLPVAYARLGEDSRAADHQLPVLLQPRFTVREGIATADEAQERELVQQRGLIRRGRTLWKMLQSSPASCFPFVETSGLLYGYRLLARTFGRACKDSAAGQDALAKLGVERLGPTLRGLNSQGVTTSCQTDLAEAMLRNLGLTDNFAQLVVFCGHAAQSANNPLHASLNCGACGGHSGEPNARLAALLLNQSYIRQALAERGIDIPSDTRFVAGLHNTTTDAVELFEDQPTKATHQVQLDELRTLLATATLLTVRERQPQFGASSAAAVWRRAMDWSEVRPEWGLAGNATFIVGPRQLTRQTNLDGRAFLHSYDHRLDHDGKVLEGIMTAPMIVTNWINMQYYASTVDQEHFGAGNKTIHNVVGQFGLLAGGGGDLLTGLPWQSVHNGQQLQHSPQRLQVIIAAPRSMIERIIDQHESVSNLVRGGWVLLTAIEENTAYRYSERGEWLPQECGELSACQSA